MTSDKPLKSLSIFFPCYNDSATIASMVVKAMAAGREVTDDLEVLVIDDASQDGSDRILSELAALYPNLKIIRHSANRGYGAALKSGFSKSAKEFIFYTDGDAQYDVFELKALVAEMRPGIDIVNGYKIKRQDSFLRVVIGNLYHTANALMLGIKIKDVDCDFRLIRRSVFDKVRLVSRGGEVCVELIRKCQDAGMRFAEVPVHHYYRRSGTSQFFVWHRLVAAAGGIWRLWKQFIFNNKKER